MPLFHKLTEYQKTFKSSGKRSTELDLGGKNSSLQDRKTTFS